MTPLETNKGSGRESQGGGPLGPRLSQEELLEPGCGEAAARRAETAMTARERGPTWGRDLLGERRHSVRRKPGKPTPRNSTGWPSLGGMALTCQSYS